MKFSIVASTVVALLASSAMAAPQRRVGGRKTITRVVVTTKTSTTFIDVTAAPTPAPEPSSSEVVPAPAPTSSSVFTPAPEPTTTSSAFTPPPAPTTSSTVIIVPTPTPTPTTTRTTATPAPAPTSSSTTVAAPAPTASSSGSFEDIVLSIHNQLRARHSAPALSWDSNLASQAASNSARCVFEHSGLGPENLVAASQRTDKGETLPQLYEREMMMWYNEVSKYDFNAGAFSSETGHFTQMVWKSATKMGCGIATNCGSSLPNFITCRYDEGNMQGAFKENVLPAQ